MISQTSEYALRAVVYLAQRGEGPAVAQEISEATKVRTGYLQKILRMLSKHGILDAQRGIGGGFALAKPASSISLLDVLRATESDIPRIERCPLGIPGHVRLCALHRLLDDQAAQTERVFETTTIGDILRSQSSTGQLCGTRTGAVVPLTRPRQGK